MTKMPDHITDEIVPNDPQNAPDEDRCLGCGESLEGRDWTDYCAACEQEAIDEAIKARRVEALMDIAGGVK